MEAPRKGHAGDSCMRILINDLKAENKRIAVSLDGNELERVVSYDCDNGVVIVHKMIDGKPVTEDGVSFAVTRLTGTVTAEIVAKS